LTMSVIGPYTFMTVYFSFGLILPDTVPIIGDNIFLTVYLSLGLGSVRHLCGELCPDCGPVYGLGCNGKFFNVPTPRLPF
jgi:hypothetical protein